MRWPELIARPRKQDFGLDAYAPKSLTPEKYGTTKTLNFRSSSVDTGYNVAVQRHGASVYRRTPSPWSRDGKPRYLVNVR